MKRIPKRKSGDIVSFVCNGESYTGEVFRVKSAKFGFMYSVMVSKSTYSIPERAIMSIVLDELDEMESR